MDLNEYKKRVEILEQKVDKINENVDTLSTVFEGILEQFEKIKKDMKNNNQ